jgi:hypothetical protein
MTDALNQEPLFAVDLRPRPAQFNARRVASQVRADVRRKCLELTQMLLRRPDMVPSKLVLESCCQFVQASEIEEDAGVDG